MIRVDPDTEAEKTRKEDKDDPDIFEEDFKFARLWLVDAELGKARCLTWAGRNVWSFGWQPDSAGLVYISTAQNTINSLFTSATLWQAPASGGIARRVAGFSPARRSSVKLTACRLLP